MRVKQIDNVLDLFELFARDGEPLTLTAIARGLSVPKSSAFNVIETLVQRGYLYETRPRGGYFPTARISEIARAINDADPLTERLHAALVELSAATGETALISTREDHEIVYLDVVESNYPIRYFARVGHRRSVHTASSGRAILSAYGEPERSAVLAELQKMQPPGEPLNLAALALELEACVERGWAEDVGETMPDVMGFGVPLTINRRRFGLALAGPAYRMQDARAPLVAQLIATRETIMAMIAGG